MNTKVVMTFTALILGITGAILTFAPDLVLQNLNVEVNRASVLLGQATGALYVGFAMLNWMSKANLIGGIYNRPVAVGNFTHFTIAALAIVKAIKADPNLPKALWVAGAFYLILAILFGVILFRHPILPNNQAN